MNYTDMQPGDLVVFDFNPTYEAVSGVWESKCKAAQKSAHGVFCLDIHKGVAMGCEWFAKAWFRPAPIQPGMSVRLVDGTYFGSACWNFFHAAVGPDKSRAPIVGNCISDLYIQIGDASFLPAGFRPVAPGTKVRHALPDDPLGLQMLMQPPLDYPEDAAKAMQECDALEDALWALLHPTDPSALRDAEAIARQDAPAAPVPGPVEFTDPVTGQRLLRYPPEVMRTHAGDEWVWVHTRGVR